MAMLRVLYPARGDMLKNAKALNGMLHRLSNQKRNRVIADNNFNFPFMERVPPEDTSLMLAFLGNLFS